MVDDTRSNHIHVEIRHHVSTHHHGAILFIESAYHCSQRVFIGIYIVTVQLHGKFAAFGVVYAHIPTTADAKVVTFRDNMDETFVVLEFINGLCRTVCGMIIDDDKVELEICLLA